MLPSWYKAQQSKLCWHNFFLSERNQGLEMQYFTWFVLFGQMKCNKTESAQHLAQLFIIPCCMIYKVGRWLVNYFVIHLNCFERKISRLKCFPLVSVSRQFRRSSTIWSLIFCILWIEIEFGKIMLLKLFPSSIPG